MRREGFVAIPGNHGLGYVSVPPISPYENALPLNDEGSTTTTTPTSPAATQKSLLQSTASSTSAAITQVHASATSEPKTVSHSVTMPSVKSDTVSETAFVFSSNDASSFTLVPSPPRLRLPQQGFTPAILIVSHSAEGSARDGTLSVRLFLRRPFVG